MKNYRLIQFSSSLKLALMYRKRLKFLYILQEEFYTKFSHFGARKRTYVMLCGQFTSIFFNLSSLTVFQLSVGYVFCSDY